MRSESALLETQHRVSCRCLCLEQVDETMTNVLVSTTTSASNVYFLDDWIFEHVITLDYDLNAAVSLAFACKPTTETESRLFLC